MSNPNLTIEPSGATEENEVLVSKQTPIKENSSGANPSCGGGGGLSATDGKSRWKKAFTTITAARAIYSAAALKKQPTVSINEESTTEKYENLRKNMRRTMSRRPNINDEDDDYTVAKPKAVGAGKERSVLPNRSASIMNSSHSLKSDSLNDVVGKHSSSPQRDSRTQTAGNGALDGHVEFALTVSSEEINNQTTNENLGEPHKTTEVNSGNNQVRSTLLSTTGANNNDTGDGVGTTSANPKHPTQQAPMRSRKSFRRDDGFRSPEFPLPGGDGECAGTAQEEIDVKSSLDGAGNKDTEFSSSPNKNREEVQQSGNRRRQVSAAPSAANTTVVASVGPRPFSTQSGSNNNAAIIYDLQQQQRQSAPCSIFSCVSCRRAMVVEPFSLAYFVPPSFSANSVATAGEVEKAPDSADTNDSPLSREKKNDDDAVKNQQTEYQAVPMGPSRTLCVRYASVEPFAAADNVSTNYAKQMEEMANKNNPIIRWQTTLRHAESNGRGSANITTLTSEEFSRIQTANQTQTDGANNRGPTSTISENTSVRRLGTAKSAAHNLTFWRRRQVVQLLPPPQQKSNQGESAEGKRTEKTATVNDLLHLAPFSVSKPALAELRERRKKQNDLLRMRRGTDVSSSSGPYAGGSAGVGAPVIGNTKAFFGLASQTLLCDTAVGFDITLCTAPFTQYVSDRSNSAPRDSPTGKDVGAQAGGGGCDELQSHASSSAYPHTNPHAAMVESVTQVVLPLVTSSHCIGGPPSAKHEYIEAKIRVPESISSTWAGRQNPHLPHTQAYVIPTKIETGDSGTVDSEALPKQESGSCFTGIEAAQPPQLACIVLDPPKAKSAFGASRDQGSGGSSAAAFAGGPPYTSGFSVDRSIVQLKSIAYNPPRGNRSSSSLGMLAGTLSVASEEAENHKAGEELREVTIAMSLLTRGGHRCSADLLGDNPEESSIDRAHSTKGYTHVMRPESELGEQRAGAGNALEHTKCGPTMAKTAPTIALKSYPASKAQRRRILALYETVSEQAGGVDLPLCAACNDERSVSLQRSVGSMCGKIRTLTEFVEAFNQLRAVKEKTAAITPLQKEAMDISVLLVGCGENAANTVHTSSPCNKENLQSVDVDEAAKTKSEALSAEIEELERELQALLIQEQLELGVTEELISYTSSARDGMVAIDWYAKEGEALRENACSRLERTLCSQSIMMKAFRFDFVNSIATVNDLRVGKPAIGGSFLFQSASQSSSSSLNAEEPPTNDEINCGCGFLIQLVLLLAAKRKIHAFSKPYRLVYNGSQSTIELRTTSGKTETMDFFINTKLFSWNTFGAAWVAFASCVADLVTNYESAITTLRATERANSANIGADFSVLSKLRELPSMPSLPVVGEQVGGYSVKYGSVSDEHWSVGARHVMILLDWCAKVDGYVSQ